MSEHGDTIRRAFLEMDDDTEMVIDRADTALDALLAERQQAQEERDKARQKRAEDNAEWRSMWIKERDRAELAERDRQQAIEALQQIAHMAYQEAKATKCARDALAKLGDKP